MKRKICTMNCGPAIGDARTQSDRMRACDDCIEVDTPAQPDTAPTQHNSRELYEFLRAMQHGEMTVSRGMELIDIWLAGNYRDDMLPPVGAQPDTEALLSRNSALEEAAAVCSTHAQQQSMFHQHAEMYCADFLANKIIKLITPEITPSPANSIAIVRAALEAAAKVCDDAALQWGYENVDICAQDIRAIDPQTILDGVGK